MGKSHMKSQEIWVSFNIAIAPVVVNSLAVCMRPMYSFLRIDALIVEEPAVTEIITAKG